MRVGVSTACLYPMETDHALDTLLKAGFRHFEIFFNTFREIQPEYVKRMKEKLDAYGADVKSIHPFTSGFEGMLLFSNYESRFEDSLEFYKQYFQAANQLGASFLVLHGQKMYPCCGGGDTYFERYARLYDLGKTHDVTVSQENVSAFLSQEPDFIRRMRQVTGERCAFTFDIKQAVRAGVDPYAMCQAMGEQIVHVHLNDNMGEKDCLVPGHGQMDYGKLFSQLSRQGFDQDIIIEVYRTNFHDVQELVEAKALMYDVLKRNLA